MRRTLVLGLAVAMALPGAAAAAKPRPNLKVSAVAGGLTTIAAGGGVVVNVTTRNAGKRRAGASSTAVYLSRDGKHRAADPRLGRTAVVALKPGEAARRPITAVVPAAVVAGSYRLVACADEGRAVREAKEGDNCRARSAPLTVTAAVTATPTPTGVPTQAPTLGPTPTPTATATATASPTATPTATATATATVTATATPTASQQITAARAAPDGPASLALSGVVVTRLKPALGTEPAGFFVQAEQTGPALFVAVDPAGQMVQAGQRVAFTITEMGTVATLRQATAISGLATQASGVALDPLEQDVSTVPDLASAVGGYESELVRLTGTLGGFASAGTGYVGAPITTAGQPTEDLNLRLRMPETVRQTLDLVAGCVVTLDAGPMWRFDAFAQPSAYSAEDVDVSSCPAPTVASATAPAGTTVVVHFDRVLDPASVAANGSQFTVDKGLTVSAASVNGSAVTLTTSAQSKTTYTVTVASTVTDQYGASVGTPASATFTGFVPNAELRLTEINPNIASSRDLIELTAVAGGSVEGARILQDGSSLDVLATLPALTVATGDVIVVHLAPAAANGDPPGNETASKSELPFATYAANYDTAWDVQGGANGLTFSNRVILLEDAAGQLQDVLPAVLSNSGSPPGAYPGDVQAVQALGQWLPANCGGAPCTYATTPSVIDISADYLNTGTTRTGNSLARTGPGDTNAKADWAVGPQSWGSAPA